MMESSNFISKLNQALELIKNSSHTTAFTGAGISVESGIPPFRGENGLWSKFDPIFLDSRYFYKYPEKSWILIKEIFYDFFGKARPNDAHYALAELENKGLLNIIITQNIDNLHQQAGSHSFKEAEIADVFILIGTTGEIQPASTIPVIAKNNGARIIEINIEASNYTHSITDLFLGGKATEIMINLLNPTLKTI